MRLRLAAAMAPLLLAAGCGAYNPLVWVGIKTIPAHPPMALAPYAESVQVRGAWSAAVGKSAGFNLRPAIAGGRVYAASADGVITVLAEDSGRVLTRLETHKPISGGLEVDEGHIFAGTIKGDVLAFDLQGKLLWSGPVAGEVLASPSVSRGIVVARTADGRIFAFDEKDGKRLWVYQRVTPPLLLRSAAGVIAMGGDVVAGYPNGKLIALDLQDGKLTWEVTVAQPRGATELERISDVAGLPVIDGGHICAGAYQGKVGCFEIATRSMLWSKDFSTAKGLAADEKNVYAIDDSDAIVAFDKATGASVWKQDKLLYRHLTRPVVWDGKVVVGDLQGVIHVLSPDTGAIIGRGNTDGTPVVSLEAGLSALFAQTAGGTVVAIRF